MLPIKRMSELTGNKRTVMILIQSILIFFLCISSSFSDVFKLGAYDKPPYMIKDTEKPGICIEIITEASRRANYESSYEILPHKRVLQFFELRYIDAEPCVSEAWRTKYSDISIFSEIYYTTENVVIVRKDSDIKLTKDIRDFRGKDIGVIHGYFITDGFQEEFEEGTITRKDVNNQGINIAKLVRKRVDGVIIDRATGLYLIMQLGYDPNEFKYAYIFETKSELGIRIHKDKSEMVNRINEVLKEMKKDGTIDRIVDKYIK